MTRARRGPWREPGSGRLGCISGADLGVDLAGVGGPVVAADAEAEQEPERDQYPVGGRQRGPQCASDHDGGDYPVHALAADYVGEAAEHERAEACGGQHRRVEQGKPARTQVPVPGDQRGGDPDDEQVVSVGEESHPRGQHRPQMEPAQRRLVQRGDQVPPGPGYGISSPPMPPASWPAAFPFCRGNYPAQATRRRLEYERQVIACCLSGEPAADSRPPDEGRQPGLTSWQALQLTAEGIPRQRRIVLAQWLAR